ncbi:MAG TPA: YibE/F family protein [Candidatus Methylomirabilis sp.]|nr:YibE/F family protein [Candidatus Methylomirabilis sp.]
MPTTHHVFRSIAAFVVAATLFPITAVMAAPTTTANTPEAPVAAPTDDGGQDYPSGVSVSRQAGSYESARVLGVRLDTVTSTRTGELRQLYDVEFRGGKLHGQRQTLSSDVEANPYQLEPKIGDKVVIFLQTDDRGDIHAFLEGFDRRIPLFWLAVLFVLTLVLLAGKQGLKVAFSIFLSILIIGFVLIPAFLKGANPVPIAIVLAGVLTFLSIGLSTGWNRQSLVTAVGTIGGTLMAYLISILFANWAHLSGLSTEEDRLFFNQNPLLNPQGLLFAGIIIAAMGVVEDVAVSIASGVEQVHRANPRLSFKDRFRAGMVVGRDHMSALANTLIFAYVGASLSTLLLYTQYGGSWLKFLNFDSVSDEVLRSLAGTIGLVFTVPITAILAAWAVGKKREN